MHLRIFYSWLLVFLLFSQEIFVMEGSLKSVRIEEIPFNLGENQDRKLTIETSKGIHLKNHLENQRGFLKIFHIPYILCFFAAKGKWPFIPTFMQGQVDNAARTLFAQEDGFIRQFCQKFIQIKECFRPIFGTATTPAVSAAAKTKANLCPCTPTEGPVIIFDRDHIGNTNADTILNTIEFLESFLPVTTRKPRRHKNRVRGRVDSIDVD